MPFPGRELPLLDTTATNIQNVWLLIYNRRLGYTLYQANTPASTHWNSKCGTESMKQLLTISQRMIGIITFILSCSVYQLFLDLMSTPSSFLEFKGQMRLKSHQESFVGFRNVEMTNVKRHALSLTLLVNTKFIHVTLTYRNQNKFTFNFPMTVKSITHDWFDVTKD